MTTNPIREQIDAQIAQRLLGIALERGGDYADLYFEYRVGMDVILEDEKIKTVGRGITLGVGVRVLKGDATGYAYSEDLSFEKMAHAARTAAQIAAGGGSARSAPVSPVKVADFYPVPVPSVETPPQEKLALLQRADRAARAYDPRIVRVEASFAESVRDVLVVSSDGRFVQDRQP